MTPLDRRSLLKAGSLGGTLAALGACRSPRVSVTPPLYDSANVGHPDARLEELAGAALDAAREAGASYADVRLADYRTQSISSREARSRPGAMSKEAGPGRGTSPRTRCS